MATNNLEVKFKVETSDLRKGSSDAKRTVKDSANQMARDVNGAAQNMASSMGRVNDATKQIANAANTASNGVRRLEQNVAQSASSMERNLSKVSRQMSAMQLFHMGVRGVQMLGGAAANIATLAGASSDTVSGINSATNVASSSLQGAALGWTMTGGNPIGAAVGGLVGAGSALLEAAVKQKEAAELQMETLRRSIKESKERIAAIDTAVQSRRRSQRAEEIANMPVGAFDEKFAQGEIDKAKNALQLAEARQNAIQDMLYGRNKTTTDILDWSALLGFEPGKNYVALPDGSMVDLAKDLPQNLGVVNWMEEGKEDAMANLIAKVVEARTVRPSSNILTPKGNMDEYGVLEEDREFYYAVNKILNFLPNITTSRPDFRREEFFKNLSANLFKTLEAKALDAAKEVAEAQKLLSELAPIQARLDKERAASEARMNAPLNFNEDDWPEYYGGDPTKEPRYLAEQVDKEAVAAGAKRLKDLTAMLNGIVGGAGFSSPTDALTRIGGGRGYASYNDSAARVQRNIEANLRTLIKNQTDQNADILHAIENIKIGEPDISWQQEQ